MHCYGCKRPIRGSVRWRRGHAYHRGPCPSVLFRRCHDCGGVLLGGRGLGWDGDGNVYHHRCPVRLLTWWALAKGLLTPVALVLCAWLACVMVLSGGVP